MSAGNGCAHASDAPGAAGAPPPLATKIHRSTVRDLRAHATAKYGGLGPWERAFQQRRSVPIGAELYRVSVFFGRITQNSFPSGSASPVQASAPVCPMSTRR